MVQVAPKPFIILTKELYNSCLEYLDRRKLSEKTKQLYTKELDTIFLNNKLTQTLYNSVYSKGNYYKSVLKLITDTCIAFDYPTFNYKSIPQKPIPSKIIQTWDEEKILKMSRDIRYYGLLIRCAYYIGGGLRFSSAIFLKWDDFKWSEWLVNRNNYGKCDIYAKGGRREVLDVHPYLMEELYQIAMTNKKLFQGIPYFNYVGNKYIFITEDSLIKIIKEIKSENLKKVIDEVGGYNSDKNLLEKARLRIIQKKYRSVAYELTKLRESFGGIIPKFHSIRASRATNLLSKGFTIMEIKKMLMHSSISTTQRYLNIKDIELENKLNTVAI